MWKDIFLSSYGFVMFLPLFLACGSQSEEWEPFLHALAMLGLACRRPPVGEVAQTSYPQT